MFTPFFSVKKQLCLYGCILLLFLLPFQKSWSQGDLMVFPKRVILTGSNRAANINLSNVGQDTARYSISFLQYRMTASGSFEEITEPDSGQRFASPYLRIFPRSVVLAPSESQTIKIQLTKTDTLPPGEYRSHLYFRSIPNPIPLGETVSQKQDSGITIRLIPVFGVTIPTIFRLGESNTTLGLIDPSVEILSDTTANLSITFNRVGNTSVYGNLTVDYYPPDGFKKQVGFAQGVSVYTPNNLRSFKLLLEKSKSDTFQAGRLHIEFTEEINFRKTKRAELDYMLP